jgi:ankyrin repeat protein
MSVHRYLSSTGYPGGRQRLWRAALTGDAPAISNLVIRPHELNEHDALGWTPLLLASAAGHTAVVRALLARGVDINATDAAGLTPLMHAAAMGYGEVVEALIRAGGDVQAVDSFGNTALHYAAAAGARSPAGDLGLGARVGPAGTGYIEPSLKQHARIAAILIEKGAVVACRNRIGQTPLALARKWRNKPVATLLSAKGKSSGPL